MLLVRSLTNFYSRGVATGAMVDLYEAALSRGVMFMVSVPFLMNAAYHVPAIETEFSVDVLIELVQLDEDDLLVTTRAHLAAQLIPLLLDDALSEHPIEFMAKGLSLVGFLRERITRKAGAYFAALLRLLLPNNGRDICESLKYCETREDITNKLGALRAAIAAAVDLGAAGEMLSEALPPEALQWAHEILEHLADLGDAIQNGIEVAGVAADHAVPVSLCFFTLLYSLDDLCECDKDVLVIVKEMPGKST